MADMIGRDTKLVDVGTGRSKPFTKSISNAAKNIEAATDRKAAQFNEPMKIMA
jgi:hypothetical protein